MICTLCHSELRRKKDAYFYECDCCKALVKDNNYYVTAEEEKERYETHNNDVNDPAYQEFTSPITRYVLENCLPDHKGLDFGSGTGPVISSVLSKEGYDISQYDPFFAPHQEVFNHRYDYIACCEVLEHFHHPKKEIDTLISLLKTNGILLIMTHLFDDKIDFDGWYYQKDPTHVFIYRKETIEYIAKQKELDITIMTNRFMVLRKTIKNNE